MLFEYMVSKRPANRFVLLQASERNTSTGLRLVRDQREELLNTKLAIELARRFDICPENLSKEQLQILEGYLLGELERVNPFKPQEGFEFVYQNTIHFFLRSAKYERVIELYTRLLKLINEHNLDINMDCAILATVAYIKTGRLDIARRISNYILDYSKKLSIENKKATEILFEELFKEHNININELTGG